MCAHAKADWVVTRRGIVHQASTYAWPPREIVPRWPLSGWARREATRLALKAYQTAMEGKPQ